MAEHTLFTAATTMKVYFADPHSPWERGTNENTNGLIRDYFPKGTDCSQISRRRIKEVQKQLNERPRKVLNWDTPVEAMTRLLSSYPAIAQQKFLAHESSIIVALAS